MDILVISDSHGKARNVMDAATLTGARTVLFLGDGLRDLAVLDGNVSVYAVRGNCDWLLASDEPLSRVEDFGGVRVFFTHGHAFSVKSTLEHALAAAATAGADVLLYGHTHVRFEKTYPAGTVLENGERLEQPLLVVCPGALEKREFATLTVRGGAVLCGFGEI